MSTLGTAGAVAGGILGGMNIKNAMEKQKLEEERLRQEMEWRREDREYQRGERERAEQERAAGDAYYAKFGATKFMQPGDPGKESIMVPADPNAPDEPTMGVARAEQTPRSEIAKVGMQEAFRDKPVDYRAASKKDANVLSQYEMEAYGLRGAERDRALSALNAKKKEVHAWYTNKFPGDKAKDPRGFANWAGEISAEFGLGGVTPEQAFEMYKFTKAMEREGAMEGLELLQRGDTAGAIKAYCTKGEQCFSRIEMTPQKSAYGLDSYEAIGYDSKTGKPVPIGNVMDTMTQISYAGKVVDLMMNKQKMDADIKNAERDDARSEKTSAAAINASNASAAASNANAAQTRLENEWMKKNGGAKPGSAPTDKSAELLNKYSSWFKSSLQIGDSMMSDIDPKEAKARQDVYERAMGIAQRAISEGRAPDYATVMKQARGGGGGSPYDAYVNAFNQAKAAGNKQAMQELTNAARSAGIVK